jgi:glycosyltransferase involved in cell wall biosynthesis
MDSGPYKTVRVIIRAYNAERFLSQAVDSVFNQTFSGKIEALILCDEGSTDKTHEIVQQGWTPHSDRITVRAIHHPHVSQFRSILFGLKDDDFDYLTFLDYDNTYHRDYLELAVRTLQATGSDFLFSNPCLIDENGAKIRDRALRIPRSFRVTKLLEPMANVVDTSTIVLDRSAAHIVTERFRLLDSSVFDWICEDWLIGGIGFLELKPYFLHGQHVDYRSHGSNLNFNPGNSRRKQTAAEARQLLTYMALRCVEGDRLPFYWKAGMALAASRVLIL